MFFTTCLASREEKRRAMPADSLVPAPMGVVTHAVTINASPDRVWPWLAQMGAGRAGWYSYDWIDNGGHPCARVSACRSGRRLARNPWHDRRILRGVGQTAARSSPDRARGERWQPGELEFLLLDQGRTRLIVRGRISRRWPGSIQERSRPPGRLILIERIYEILAHTPRPPMLAAASFGHYIMQARMGNVATSLVAHKPKAY